MLPDHLPPAAYGQLQPGTVAAIDRATAMAAHGAPRCCAHKPTPARRYNAEAAWWICNQHHQLGLLCHACLRRHVEGEHDEAQNRTCDRCGRQVDWITVHLVPHLPRPTRVRPPRSAVTLNRADKTLLTGIGLCGPCTEHVTSSS